MTPTTAGNELLARLMHFGKKHPTFRGYVTPGDIAAIEAEARQQERARLAFEVEALNHTIVLGGRGLGEIHEPTRAAVLSLLSGDAGGTS